MVSMVPNGAGTGAHAIASVSLYEDVAQKQNRFGRAHAHGVSSELLLWSAPTTDGSGFLSNFSAIAGIGDLTGDGRGEVLLGTQIDDAVHVIGADGGLVRTLRETTAPGRTTYFGGALAALPDRTGDGVPDIAVSALFGTDATGTFQEGNVAIMNGATGARLATIYSPASAGSPSGFGYSVAAADATSHAGTEVAVGAVNVTVGFTSSSGRVYLFSGTEQVGTVDTPNPALNGLFGTDIAALRTSGSAQDELVITAPGENVDSAPDGFYAGRAYVANGATGAIRLQLHSPEPQSGGRFGRSVAVLDDVNGDGSPDIAIGAPIESPPGAPGGGRVHLFDGISGALIRTIVSPEPRSSGEFGTDIAALPDVDGDGRGDLAVGAPGDGFGNGRVYIISGATGQPTLPAAYRAIIDALLARTEPGSGLDGNADGVVDGADVAASSVGAGNPN